MSTGMRIYENCALIHGVRKLEGGLQDVGIVEAQPTLVLHEDGSADHKCESDLCIHRSTFSRGCA